jgi:hypothetical protein
VTGPTAVAERCRADFDLARSYISAALRDLERQRLTEGL